MRNFKVALDWTANTNHTGFYVAKEKGFYENLNLNVELLTPDSDNYKVTPAKKVELGQANVALCPFESVISYRTKKNSFDAAVIAAVYREDMSAIVSTLKIKSPKDLDGLKYASYQARYEDEIVRQMIKNDGGNGEFNIVYPEKLGIWETIVNNKFDSTWIFMNWEGIQAKSRGIQLNVFKMSDYGIPYSYSPIIMANEKMVHEDKDIYADFLKATKKGFMYAVENSEEAVQSIAPYVAEQDKDIDLVESQKYASSYYGNKNNWGVLEESEVNEFLEWLYLHNIEKQRFKYEDLIVNGLL